MSVEVPAICPGVNGNLSVKLGDSNSSSSYNLKWVVIKNGVLLIFKDDISQFPSGIYSLQGSEFDTSEELNSNGESCITIKCKDKSGPVVMSIMMIFTRF